MPPPTSLFDFVGQSDLYVSDLEKVSHSNDDNDQLMFRPWIFQIQEMADRWIAHQEACVIMNAEWMGWLELQMSLRRNPWKHAAFGYFRFHDPKELPCQREPLNIDVSNVKHVYCILCFYCSILILLISTFCTYIVLTRKWRLQNYQLSSLP